VRRRRSNTSTASSVAERSGKVLVGVVPPVRSRLPAGLVAGVLSWRALIEFLGVRVLR
jgi:hypothetical protein